MNQNGRTWKVWVTIAVLALIVGVPLLPLIGHLFPRDHWTREHPLEHPIHVTGVKDGAISLEDGRVLRLAGVVRAPDVTSEQFDDALTAMTAQGVEVIRDLGDGRAMLRGEPGFYNWCGTRSWDGSRWAGGFLQERLSELLMVTGYVKYNDQEADLTPKEKWRLEGVARPNGFWIPPSRPEQIWQSRNIRFGSYAWSLQNCDELLATDSEPPAGD